jgi:hypothetical protein
VLKQKKEENKQLWCQNERGGDLEKRLKNEKTPSCDLLNK